MSTETAEELTRDGFYLLIAVTPKGVEHDGRGGFQLDAFGLLIAVTPKGVEHRRPDLRVCCLGVRLLIAVTPKGVEHTDSLTTV